MLMFTINAIQNCICINLFYDSVKLNVNHTCLFMQGLNTNTLNLVVCASALSCFIIEIQFVDNVIIMKPKGHLTQVTVFHVWLFCLNLLVYWFKHNLNYSSFHSVHFVRLSILFTLFVFPFCSLCSSFHSVHFVRLSILFTLFVPDEVFSRSAPC
jgi:hypothetical protein